MTIVDYKALGSRVIVVATATGDYDWSAYIDSVPGISHEREFQRVAETGTKISKELATFLFPTLAKKNKWRY